MCAESILCWERDSKGLWEGKWSRNPLPGRRHPAQPRALCPQLWFLGCASFLKASKTISLKLLPEATGDKTTKDRNCLKARKALNSFVPNWFRERTQQTKHSLTSPLHNLWRFWVHLTWFLSSSATCHPPQLLSCLAHVDVVYNCGSFLSHSHRGDHRGAVPDTPTAVSADAEAAAGPAAAEAAISAFLPADTSESTGTAATLPSVHRAALLSHPNGTPQKMGDFRHFAQGFFDKLAAFYKLSERLCSCIHRVIRVKISVCALSSSCFHWFCPPVWSSLKRFH